MSHERELSEVGGSYEEDDVEQGYNQLFGAFLEDVITSNMGGTLVVTVYRSTSRSKLET